MNAQKRSARAHEADECEVWRESSRDPWESENDGLRLACLEADRDRLVHAFACLTRVEHAREKIQEGTCEFSDVSGRQIARERLEIVPDAISSLNDEQAFERVSELGRLQ